MQQTHTMPVEELNRLVDKLRTIEGVQDIERTAG